MSRSHTCHTRAAYTPDYMALASARLLRDIKEVTQKSRTQHHTDYQPIKSTPRDLREL